MKLGSASNIAEMARQSVEMRLQMMHYVQTEGFANYTQAFMGALMGFDAMHPDQTDSDAITIITMAQQQAWQQGRTSLLAPAMTSVVAAAAASLDLSDTVVTWNDMPDQGGVLFLPEPIYINLMNGKMSGISAITWNPVFTPDKDDVGHSGVLIIGYADSSDMLDDEMRDLDQHMRKQPNMRNVRGPYMPCYLQLLPLNELAGTKVLGYPDSEPVTRVDWTTNNEDKIVLRDKPGKISTLIHILYSFWMISQQPIAVAAQPQVPKGLNKRALRASLVHDTRVVMLRRSSDVGHHPHGESRWGYSVRFVVRGHWRRLIDKDGRPYRIWINAYIKGPEDAPLLGGEKVTVLGR